MPSHAIAGDDGTLCPCVRWVAASRIRRSVYTHAWRGVAGRLAGLGAELSWLLGHCQGRHDTGQADNGIPLTAP